MAWTARAFARRTPMRWPVLLAALLGLAACATPQERVTQREDNLAAAGFIVRPANTPARQAMLNSLPPHHFVTRVQGDTVRYLYADPLVCDCIYIGSQQAYDRFRLYQQQKQLADEEELNAQPWAGPGWDWGPWAPW